MKKLICTGIFILLSGSFQWVSGQNPIPSFNVPVYHLANFQESQPPKGKRDMNVIIHGVEVPYSDTCKATVWVYSLDRNDILGPYTLYNEETLSVGIDDREWGVIIESEDHVTADVWISDEGKMPVPGIIPVPRSIHKGKSS